MTLLDLLVKNPIFTHQESEVSNQLSDLAISRQYPKGQWITHHGQAGVSHFYTNLVA
jgi:hypothetical protein